MSDQLERPTLEYAAASERLTRIEIGVEIGRALLPATSALLVGIALPLAIARYLTVRYGPAALTQWTNNVAQIEFWSYDVPLIAWLILWAVSLAVALKRCRTAAGRSLAIAAGIVVFVSVGLTFSAIMDGPFP